MVMVMVIDGGGGDGRWRGIHYFSSTQSVSTTSTYICRRYVSVLVT